MEGESSPFKPSDNRDFKQNPHRPASVYIGWREGQNNPDIDPNVQRENLAQYDALIGVVDKQIFNGNYFHIESTRFPGNKPPGAVFILDERSLMETYAHDLPGITPPEQTTFTEETKPLGVYITEAGYSDYPVGHGMIGNHSLVREVAQDLPSYAAYVAEQKAKGEKIQPRIYVSMGTLQGQGTETSDEYVKEYEQNPEQAEGILYGDVYKQILEKYHATESPVMYEGTSMGASTVYAALEQNPDLQKNARMRLVGPAAGHGGALLPRTAKGIRTVVGFAGEVLKRYWNKDLDKRLNMTTLTDRNVERQMPLTPASPDELARKKRMGDRTKRRVVLGTGMLEKPMPVPTEIVVSERDLMIGKDIAKLGEQPNVTVRTVKGDHIFPGNADEFTEMAKELNQAKAIVRHLYLPQKQAA